MKKKISNFLRKIIPRKIQTIIRFYQILNNSYGHSNLVDGFIRSGDNQPLPWISYPAIEFLNTLDLKDCDVFEYGSGSSTLYWASKTRSVTSVEKDRNWFQKVKMHLPNNCELYLNEKDLDYIERIKSGEKKYHIIIIDGAVRFPCTQTAVKHLTDNGMIIVDNSEWYPNSCKYLRDSGFVQIDFAGFTPLNAFPSATSIFYQIPELLEKKSVLQPMSSRRLKAYDDKSFEQIDTNLVVT